MDWYDPDGMSGWMWMWGAALLVGGLVVITGLVWAIMMTTTRRASAPVMTPGSTPPARQILDERYARGELDTQEYRERVQALGGRA